MLFKQIVKEILELLFNHIKDAVRPTLSSVQILALTHLGYNHDGGTKLFISKGRDICLMHTHFINRIGEHLANRSTCKNVTLIESRLLEMVSYPYPFSISFIAPTQYIKEPEII